MGRLLVIVCLFAACGGHGSSAAACHELSLGECRNTPGCKPDLCDGCICQINVRGCLAESETPAQCPQIGCAGGECCGSQAQCQANTTCAPPGTPQACGACNTDPGNCTSDAQCKASGVAQICEPVACTCDDKRSCVPGCTTDATCGEGTRCDVASARCVALTCATDPECPGNFRCGTDHSCVRSSCTKDADCDGFCVLGQCFGGGRGECRPPSA